MNTRTAQTIVQLVHIDETGDSYYRMRWPARQLAEQAPEWRIINLDARAKERITLGEEADLLVIYQSHDLELLPLIARRRSAGKKTLVEYNDNFYAPPAATPVAEAWSSPLLWQIYERFMHESDGVIVTGPGLKELFSKRTSVPIYILENHIPHELPEFEKSWSDPNTEIRLGLAGSLGHMSDYLAILPALRQALERHPRLKLCVMGNESLPDIIGAPKNQFEFTHWGPMSEYYEFLRGLHIGLAPMLDTPYNRCRSDVKALELGSSAVLPLLADALPYEQFKQKTGAPIFKNLDELAALIDGCVNQPGSIREAVKRCYDYIAAERIGLRRTERFELYSRHLAEKSSAYLWPVSAGSHELTGDIEDVPGEARLISETQQLLKSGDKSGALDLLQKSLAVNPFAANAALAELKILQTGSGAELWLKRYDEHIKNFPDDLRFPLLILRRMTNFDQALACWTSVCGKLLSASAAYRNFFGSQVLQTFLEQFSANDRLLPIAEMLVQVYPHSAALRFGLGQLYDRSGRSEEALKHAQWIIETFQAESENQEFFKKIDQTFLRTWRDSLAGRVELSKK